MKAKPKQYARGLFEALDGANEKQAKAIIERFVRLLTSNNHSSQFDRILSFFVRTWNEKNMIVPVEISSAWKLGKNAREGINEHIKKINGGRSTEVSETIDESLLGGVVVKYDDKIIDASLKTRINEFKNHIAK